MSTNVYESTVVCASIDAVWQLIRNCDFRFLNAVEGAKLEYGGSWCEVGSVRCITYADKNHTRRWYSLDELSDANHQLTYSMLDAEPEVPVQAAVHTIRLRRVTKPANNTFIQFVTEFSRDVTDAVLEESRAHKAAFFAGVNRALRQDFAKDQREPEHHTPLQRLLEAKHGKAPVSGRAAECRGPQVQRNIPTSAAPTFASSGQIAGKQEPMPLGGARKSAPPVVVGPFGREREVQIGHAQDQPRGFQEGMKKACCGCSLPCDCVCCRQPKQADTQGQGIGQKRPESQFRGVEGKPAMIKAAAPSQRELGTRDIPIRDDKSAGLRADEKTPLRVAVESPSHRAGARGISRRRPSVFSRGATSSGKCHPESFSKASEIFERADFDALKTMTEKQVDELWQSLPKESHGALRVDDAEDFVDVLMDRLSEEDNDMIQFVAKMLQEPGSPPSFVVDENFTPQLRDELKRWKHSAAKKLIGKLDRNRDGLIGKEEFQVLFSDWFSRQVYDELRASFFG